MNYLVWILTNGRLSPQLWAERSYAVDKRSEEARIVVRHKLAEEHRDLSLFDLAGLYPATVEVAA